jgi:hypothetical protein
MEIITMRMFKTIAIAATLAVSVGMMPVVATPRKRSSSPT